LIGLLVIGDFYGFIIDRLLLGVYSTSFPSL